MKNKCMCPQIVNQEYTYVFAYVPSTKGQKYKFHRLGNVTESLVRYLIDWKSF